jgi:hypothetical protein
MSYLHSKIAMVAQEPVLFGGLKTLFKYQFLLKNDNIFKRDYQRKYCFW